VPQSVVLLAPPAASPLTGGYLYNRLIAEHLETDGRARYRWVSRRDLVPLLSQLGARPPLTPAVVDSLYFTLGPLQRQPRKPRLAMVLLCHVIPWQFWPKLPEPGSIDRYLAGVAGIVTTSLATTAELRHTLAERRIPLPVAACPPGVDLDRFSPAVAPHRSTASHAALTVLTVANVQGEKGYLFLLEALADLRALPWRWRIAGDCAVEPETVVRLRARVAELGLEQRVELLGALAGAALVAEYQRADLMVLATERESFGMALVEALACAVPVLVSDLAGTAEALASTGGGVLVPTGERMAWRRALRSLLTDPQRRAQLRQRALDARGKLQTWDAAAQRFVAAIARIVAQAA